MTDGKLYGGTPVNAGLKFDGLVIEGKSIDGLISDGNRGCKLDGLNTEGKLMGI